MPDVAANRRQWGDAYAWPEEGDEWSAGWGGPDAQWHSTLLPRLRRFLPAPAILQHAPRYGHYTRYLYDCGARCVGVRLSGPRLASGSRRAYDVQRDAVH